MVHRVAILQPLRCNATITMIKRLLILALFLPTLAQAQYLFQSQATGTQSIPGSAQGISSVVAPIPYATVYICSGAYVPGTSCTTGTATVYADSGLTTPYQQPVAADANGNFSFYVQSGTNYYYTVSGSGFTAQTFGLTAPNYLPGVSSDGANGLNVQGNVQGKLRDDGGQVYNVLAYGADPTGATDSAPAFRSAIAALPTSGGTIYIPPGNYTLESIDPNDQYSILTTLGINGVHFQCAKGATLTVPDIPGATTSGFALFTMGEYYGLEQQTGYPFTAIPSPGASSLTLTTPSDASNFSVGQPIYIKGGPGAGAQPDGEINWVTSVNATTGVIGLLKPTGKPFTGAGSSALDVVPAPANAFTYNQSIEGCRVNITASTDQVNWLYLYESIGTVIENNIVTNPNGGDMWINSYYPFADLTIKNNIVQWSKGTLYQIADGQRDVVIEGNDFSSSSSPMLLNPSQGAESVTISNNNLYLVTPSGTTGNFYGPIQATTSYNVTITGNNIFANGESSTVPMQGIGLYKSNGGCSGCTVTGNRIVVQSAQNPNGLFGIQAGPPDETIDDNSITTNGYGIQLYSNATAQNNEIHLTGSDPYAGILAGGVGDSVVGNSVYGDSNAQGSGIYTLGHTVTGTIIANNVIDNLQYGFNIGTTTPDLIDNQCTAVGNSQYCGQIRFANDTDLYRSSAGVLTTDGALNAVTGYQINGSYGTAGQFLSSTGTGTQFAYPGVGSGTPTIACGTGAGASPTVCSISGNQFAGQISVTTGSAPASSAIIATITLAHACPTSVYAVVRGSNAAAASLNGTSHEYPDGFTASSWTLTSNSTGLTASTAYTWSYIAGCN